MVKRALLTIVILALASPAARAGNFGLNVAYWDTDDAEDDVGLGGRVAFDVGEYVDFQVRGAFFDDLEVTTPEGTVKLEAFPLDLGLAYGFLPDGPVNPYLGAGASYHFFSPRSGRVKEEAGWFAVAGVEAALEERWGIFAELLFRDVKATHEDTDPPTGTTDLDLGGLAANVGFLLSW
jgi:opacity protein-like surface antigen